MASHPWELTGAAISNADNETEELGQKPQLRLKNSRAPLGRTTAFHHPAVRSMGRKRLFGTYGRQQRAPEQNVASMRQAASAVVELHFSSGKRSPPATARGKG